MPSASWTVRLPCWGVRIWSGLGEFFWTTLWSTLAFPIAVLSHEAAHFAAYLVFGFPVPVLHYGSTQFEGQGEFWKMANAGHWEDASAILPPYQVGIACAAGIVASWLVMALCIIVVRRNPHPFFLALGFISTLRFLGGVFIIFAGALGRSGSDEGHVAVIFSLPEGVLQIIGIASMFAAWYFLYCALPAEKRISTACLLFLGAIAGGFIYAGVLGPLLLP